MSVWIVFSCQDCVRDSLLKWQSNDRFLKCLVSSNHSWMFSQSSWRWNTFILCENSVVHSSPFFRILRLQDPNDFYTVYCTVKPVFFLRENFAVRTAKRPVFWNWTSKNILYLTAAMCQISKIALSASPSNNMQSWLWNVHRFIHQWNNDFTRG